MPPPESRRSNVPEPKNPLGIVLRLLEIKYCVSAFLLVFVLLFYFQYEILHSTQVFAPFLLKNKFAVEDPVVSTELFDLFKALSYPPREDFSYQELLPYYRKAHAQIESYKIGAYYEADTHWAMNHSCRSRHERFQFHTKNVPPPSPNFFAILYRYAEFHKNCTSQVKGWNHENDQDQNATGCKYMYVIPRDYHGLGNKLLSVTSSIVYAILSQRVLFISGNPFADLLCEPFPYSTWTLPFTFPPSRANEIVSLASYLKSNLSFTNVKTRYGPEFTNEYAQMRLKRVPWLWMHSNVYYIPELYTLPSFNKLLEEIFPDRLVFTHLSRHFILPNDYVWKRILLLKRGYMTGADHYVGMHLRYLVLEEKREHWLNHMDHFNYINDRVMDCALNTSKSLPVPYSLYSNHPNEDGNIIRNNPLVSIFVASQFADSHSQFFKSIYFDGGRNGESVSVQHVTATHHQNSDKEEHVRALIEMWLLSFVDDLFTSANSTFSFIAQGLGGHAPWVLNFSPHSQQFPSCTKRSSSEPCHLNFSSAFSNQQAGIPSGNVSPPLFETCPDKTDSFMLRYTGNAPP